MKSSGLLSIALLLTTADSLVAPQKASKAELSQLAAKAAATLGLIASVAAPLPSQAATEVVKIDVDIPKLIEFAKDNKDELIKIAKSTTEAVSISKLPTNPFDFARDALAGDVLVNVNGYPIDISLSSTMGGIDVAVSAEQGELSLSVASELIPKLPLMEKQTALRTPETVVERLEAAAAGPISIWDQKFFIDLFGQGWTNKNVVGSTALGLGLAYGGSYALYEASNAAEEREAEERRQANKKKAAAKKEAAVKKAAAAKKEEAGKKAVDKAKIVENVAVAASLSEKPVEEAAADKKSKRKWYKFWKRG